MTLPRGRSEPVAVPMSGGFSGSPPPDPLRAYVTLIVAARAGIAAQKLSATAPATVDRKVLEFTLHILSFSVSETHQSRRGHQGVVASHLCLFLQLNKDGRGTHSPW